MNAMKLDCSVMGFAKPYNPSSRTMMMMFKRNPTANLRVSVITCGLRRERRRKPLWRSRVLSSEAIQAVHLLKLAKSDFLKLDCVVNNRISRLIKADLLDALAELRRQNQLQLAVKVFNCVREEAWYKPDLSIYCDMIQVCGRSGLIEIAEELFGNLQKEGLEPNTRTFTEMIGAYLQVGMIPEALETYRKMKASGCVPEKLTFAILIRHLENAGDSELAESLKTECMQYVDDSKFLKGVEKKHRRQALDLV